MQREEPRLDGIISPRGSRAYVLDTVADLAHDAVEFGDVDADEIADALEEAAIEVRQYNYEPEPAGESVSGP